MEPGPRLTCDVIIRLGDDRDRIVLIRRKYPPPGWALPGGFVDPGETVEQAAAREALEETGLEVTDLRQFHVYSHPRRAPRGHTGSAEGEPRGGDDAAEARVFGPGELPPDIAFDHRAILEDYLARRYP